MSITHAPSTTHRLALAAIAAGLAVTLSACGNDDTTNSSPTGPSQEAASSAPSSPSAAVAADHNDADVAFINDMTPHHSSAIDMAQLAATRAGSPQVKELAAKIAAAQGPEQDAMKTMAAAWGVPAPSTDPAMAGPHTSMGSAMPSPSGMTMDHGMAMDTSALQALSGTAFDKQFLRMMTEHHRSALPMAQAELSGGRNPQAKQLAQDIVTAQTAEISQMQAMLTTV